MTPIPTPHNRSLTTLSLANQMSVGGGAAAVIAEHAPRLTTLVMANVGGLNDTAAESIGKLAALRQLQIDLGGFGDAGVMAIARGCRALRTLVLFESRVSVLGARAIAAQLQQLVVFRATMCGIDDAAAQAIASLGSLEAVFVRRNYIGDAGARALAAHDRLKTLDVEENRIGDEGEEVRCRNLDGASSPSRRAIASAPECTLFSDL